MENKEPVSILVVDDDREIADLVEIHLVSSPIEIGSLGGKKLYVSFFVWTPNISQGKRIFNYCLYLSE